jgi:transposase
MIAKNVFQIAGMDEKGKIILVKRLSRQKLMEFVGNFPPCVIGIEACGGCQFLARKFKEFGHDVKLMSPEFVKPYVKGGNKNEMMRKPFVKL